MNYYNETKFKKITRAYSGMVPPEDFFGSNELSFCMRISVGSITTLTNKTSNRFLARLHRDML